MNYETIEYYLDIDEYNQDTSEVICDSIEKINLDTYLSFNYDYALLDKDEHLNKLSLMICLSILNSIRLTLKKKYPSA